jgi:hypothetical protein
LFFLQQLKFGGKLVSFGRTALTDAVQSNEQLFNMAQVNNQRISISQVITDKKLVDEAQYLDNTLRTGNLLEFCNYKIETANGDSIQSNAWKFILATLDKNKNYKYLELLGFDEEALQSKLIGFLGSNASPLKQSSSNSQQINGNSTTLFDNKDTNNEIQNGLSTTSSIFDNLKLNDEGEESFNVIKRSQSPINLYFTNGKFKFFMKSLKSYYL